MALVQQHIFTGQQLAINRMNVIQSYFKEKKYKISDVFIIGIILLYLVVCHYFQNATVDDVYISMKYAKNFALGNGLVFNIGEKIEGYSNFLWVLLLSGASILSMSLPYVSKVLSVCFGAGAIWLVWKILNKFLAPKSNVTIFVSVFTVFIFSITYAFSYWSASGMETTLYTFLVLLSLITQLKTDEKYAFKSSSIVFVLLALCRVEGIVFYSFSIIAKILAVRQSGNKNIKRYIYEGVIVGVAFLGFLVFRYTYFGEIMPNTYFAKIGGSPWRDGIWYIIDFLKIHYILVGVAFVGLFVMDSKFRFLRNLLVTYILGYTGLVIYIGGDWMWHSRFFVPLIPLLYIAAANGVVKGINWILNLKINGIYKKISILILISFILYPMKDIIIREGDWKNILKSKVKKPAFNIEALIIDSHKELAEYLNTVISPNAVVAANHIGALGFYSKFKVLDMVGLINPVIAKQDKRFHEKYDAEAILDKRPDYIILTTRTKPTDTEFVSDYWIGETVLYNHNDFKNNYFKWNRFWTYEFDNKSEYLVVYERTNSLENPYK